MNGDAIADGIPAADGMVINGSWMCPASSRSSSPVCGSAVGADAPFRIVADPARILYA